MASVTAVDTDETAREKRVRTSEFEDDTAVRPGRQTVTNGKEFTFPIVMPPYGKEGSQTPSDQQSCLLYLESVTVVVFNAKNRDPSSAVAEVIGTKANKNTYNYGDGSVDCFKDPSTFKFLVDVNVNTKVDAKKNKDDTNILFSVPTGKLTVGLEFKLESTRDWRLQKATANSIHVVPGNGQFIPQKIDLTAGDEGLVTYAELYGFGNYSFACSSTAAIVWPVGKKEDGLAVGISFNNIQVQPFGTVVSDDAKTLRFGRDVNDCVGLFSIGSWMGIIVALLLIGVFFFGFLMLNSVQTMDRFDDPKQKQLIINAKE